MTSTGSSCDAPRHAFRIALIGLSSAALYLVVYLAQRAMFLNGRGEAPVDGARMLVQGAGYYGATLLLFALYGWVLLLCHRGLLRDGRARKLAILIPVLFNLALLFGSPHQSIDALTYVAHGYLGNLPDANPYTTQAASVAGMEVGRDLASFGWLPVHGPSPYGPLWTHLEVLAFAASGSVPVALLIIKVLVVAASLGSAALIWTILGRVRPEDQLLGTLVYLWNPMVLMEFAAEGHNDALMILCVLLSLLFTVSARPALSIVALTLGVLVKYLPIMLLPAQFLYLWRASDARLVPRLCLGALAGTVLAVAAFAPFWAGGRTLDALGSQGEPYRSSSPPGWLFSGLLQIVPPDEAARYALLILGILFVDVALVLSWRARGTDGLLRACAGIALVYLLLASTEYWPWYASLPVALLALAPRGTYLFAAVAISVGSRLTAPVSVLFTREVINVEFAVAAKTIGGVTAPLFLILMYWSWCRFGRNTTTKE